MLMMASSSSTIESAVLRTASDSPVRAMLMVDISYWRMSRASAEMLSPSSSCTRSPGTRSATATIVTSPSRTTLALAGTIFCSASVAFSARYSWKKPMVAFSSTTPTMAMATLIWSCRSEPCDSTAAITHSTAAASSMMAKSVLNWSKKRKMIGRPTLAGSTLRPYCLRRRKASSSVRPRGEVWRRSKTSSVERLQMPSARAAERSRRGAGCAAVGCRRRLASNLRLHSAHTLPVVLARWDGPARCTSRARSCKRLPNGLAASHRRRRPSRRIGLEADRATIRRPPLRTHKAGGRQYKEPVKASPSRLCKRGTVARTRGCGRGRVRESPARRGCRPASRAGVCSASSSTLLGSATASTSMSLGLAHDAGDQRRAAQDLLRCASACDWPMTMKVARVSRANSG